MAIRCMNCCYKIFLRVCKLIFILNQLSSAKLVINVRIKATDRHLILRNIFCNKVTISAEHSVLEKLTVVQILDKISPFMMDDCS